MITYILNKKNGVAVSVNKLVDGKCFVYTVFGNENDPYFQEYLKWVESGGVATINNLE